MYWEEDRCWKQKSRNSNLAKKSHNFNFWYTTTLTESIATIVMFIRESQLEQKYKTTKTMNPKIHLILVFFTFFEKHLQV